MDADTFFMALSRFISCRGKHFELPSDCRTNFKAGKPGLQGAFKAMSPDVQKQLAHFQVNFRFNLPSAPHFGGAGNEKSNPSKWRVDQKNLDTSQLVMVIEP